MGGPSRFDFFLSRRGSVASIALEVTDVLKQSGYRVLTRDYDIPITANLIEETAPTLLCVRDADKVLIDVRREQTE